MLITSPLQATISIKFYFPINFCGTIVNKSKKSVQKPQKSVKIVVTFC